MSGYVTFSHLTGELDQFIKFNCDIDDDDDGFISKTDMSCKYHYFYVVLELKI